MKYLILLLITFSLSSCISTIKLFTKEGKLMGILPLENGAVVYREKINTVELPKEEVFRRARRWWVNHYRSAKDVFQIVDKETGEIVGKGYSKVYIENLDNKGRKISLPYSLNVYHTISCDVKDDECEISIYGFVVEQPVAAGKAIFPVEFHVEDYNVGTVRSVTNVFRALDANNTQTMASLKGYIKGQYK